MKDWTLEKVAALFCCGGFQGIADARNNEVKMLLSTPPPSGSELERFIMDAQQRLGADAARAGVRVAMAMNEGHDEFAVKKTCQLVDDVEVNNVTVAVMNAAVEEWQKHSRNGA